MNLDAELPRKENHPAATPKLTNFRLKRLRSSIGVGKRSSHQTNAAPASTVAIAPEMISPEVQPNRSPLPTTNKNPSRAKPENTAPPQSNRWRASSSAGGSGLAKGRISIDMKMVKIPTGTLAKKTERHSNALTSSPPMAGPAIAPAPTTLRWVPRALPRSVPGNDSITMAMPALWTMAEPTPWNILAAINEPRLGDTPASAAAMTKMTIPPMYTCFRPMMSPRRPMGKIRTLMTKA